MPAHSLINSTDHDKGESERRKCVPETKPRVRSTEERGKKEEEAKESLVDVNTPAIKGDLNHLHLPTGK